MILSDGGRPRMYEREVGRVMVLRAAGHTVRDIASMTGVPRSVVSRIIRGDGGYLALRNHFLNSGLVEELS